MFLWSTVVSGDPDVTMVTLMSLASSDRILQHSMSRQRRPDNRLRQCLWLSWSHLLDSQRVGTATVRKASISCHRLNVTITPPYMILTPPYVTFSRRARGNLQRPLQIWIRWSRRVFQTHFCSREGALRTYVWGFLRFPPYSSVSLSTTSRNSEAEIKRQHQSVIPSLNVSSTQTFSFFYCVTLFCNPILLSGKCFCYQHVCNRTCIKRPQRYGLSRQVVQWWSLMTGGLPCQWSFKTIFTVQS